MFEWPIRPQKTFVEGGKTIYHPLYFRWRAMMGRCYRQSNDGFPQYGARGIYVCKEWHDFWAFVDWVIATYEEGKSIDRIDNNGPYSPTNCRWATPLEQQLNSRITPARIAAIKYASTLRRKHRKYRKRDGYGRFI